MRLRIEASISDFPREPQQWYAVAESDGGSPMYDAAGPTIELALAGLIKELMQALEDTQ